MSRVHDIERRIDQKLRALLRPSSSLEQKREILEVHRSILDEVASRVDKLPRGKLAFAYSHVSVRILLADPQRRRSYELVFLEGDALARDIRTRLVEDGAEIPAKLKIDIEVVDTLPEDVAGRGFDVSYGSGRGSELPSEGMQIRLIVLSGSAELQQYDFRKKRIHLGRLAEVLDAQHHLVRRNDLAFIDEPTNSTVSRTHAHLEFDPEIAAFRLFDDRSTYGTTVIRDGTVIAVPHGASKGVALQTGDEILLGKVRLQFELCGVANS